MQLRELRAFAVARGWTVTGEYVDRGVSGSKERRGHPHHYERVWGCGHERNARSPFQGGTDGPIEAKLICE
jgi:hypothetical protein